jgi:hypothetical protein
VEWLYAFDVHCNAFFPLFLLLYVAQYFLLPVLLNDGFVALLCSNTLFALAFSYYHYITFLGYSALPFLKDTQRFLLPISGVFVLYAPVLFSSITHCPMSGISCRCWRT